MAAAPTPEPDPIDGASDQPEVIQPEVMGREDHPEAVVPSHPAREGYSALERASDAALAMPGLPGRDEFLGLAMQARILSMSAGAPKAVRDNPHLAFHVAMVGRDLGISPSAALQLVDVIGYNEHASSYEAAYANVQLSISPELLNSQIKRMGLGSIVKAGNTDTQCTAVALEPGGRLDYRCARPEQWPDHVDGCTCTHDKVLGAVTFDWADGIQAGLVDSACTGPQAHTAICVAGGNGSRGKRCHQGYRTYPKRMMWWRAASWCQSDYFPEAGVGLYTPEELGAMVDSEGRAIDPADVELPEGYEPKALPPPPPSEDLLADAEDDSDLARERRELRGRLDAIGVVDDARAALMELWQQRNDDDSPKTPPFPHLRRRHLTRAKAITKQVEDRIKRGEWGDEAKTAWADAAVSGAGFGARAPQEPQAPDDDATVSGGAAEPAGAPAATEDPPGADPAADRDAEVLAEFDKAVATPSTTELEVRAARQAPATTAEGIAKEVVAMDTTTVLSMLADLLPEGESVPRTKDARHTRLIDLLLAERTSGGGHGIDLGDTDQGPYIEGGADAGADPDDTGTAQL